MLKLTLRHGEAVTFQLPGGKTIEAVADLRYRHGRVLLSITLPPEVVAYRTGKETEAVSQE